MKKLFTYIDNDNSGKIEYGEFCALLGPKMATRKTLKNVPRTSNIQDFKLPREKRERKRSSKSLKKRK